MWIRVFIFFLFFIVNIDKVFFKESRVEFGEIEIFSLFLFIVSVYWEWEFLILR